MTYAYEKVDNKIDVYLDDKYMASYRIDGDKVVYIKKDKPNSYNHSVNQTVKPKEEKEPKNEGTNSTVNQTVITERLTNRLDSSLFTSEEMKLITILWDGNNVKQHDPLVIRRDILKVIGDTKINTVSLRNLYKKLLELDYIYKRVGYFAKVGL
jgi:hypothetical protein